MRAGLKIGGLSLDIDKINKDNEEKGNPMQQLAKAPKHL